VGSAEIKAAMKGRGVRGVPEIAFFQGAGATAMY
jgi:thiol:disulfide interchange protein